MNKLSEENVDAHVLSDKFLNGVFHYMGFKGDVTQNDSE